MAKHPKIVILGSGYAGAGAARTIQSTLGKRVDLTVVEKRTCNIHKMASARAATLGRDYSDRVLVPNYELVKPGYGTMVHEEILAVTANEVKCSNNVTLSFDYLICATGAKNFSIAEPHLKYADKGAMTKFYEKVANKIKKAQKILIVGGGPVGAELAGEIKFEYPRKAVTIIHKGDRLMSNTKPTPSRRFSRMLTDSLQKMGVTVHLGQKLNLPPEAKRKPYISGEREYTTDAGQAITADLVLVCTGKMLNNKFYPERWCDSETRSLKVRATLQLLEHYNIFAAGDINDVFENKQGYFARKQGELAAKNVARLIRGKEKLAKYVPGFGTNRTFMFLSLGRERGVSYFGYVSMGSSVTVPLKCKYLFTKDFWTLYRIKTVPKERGGPSRGNKILADASKTDLNLTDSRLPKLQELQTTNRDSMMSTGTLASAFGDDDDGLYVLTASNKSVVYPPTQNTLPIGAKFIKQVHVPGADAPINRSDLISFKGAAPSPEAKVNENLENSQQEAVPTLFSPMTGDELSRSRRVGSRAVSQNSANVPQVEQEVELPPIPPSKSLRRNIGPLGAAKEQMQDLPSAGKRSTGISQSGSALFQPMSGLELQKSRKRATQRATNASGFHESVSVPPGLIQEEEDDW